VTGQSLLNKTCIYSLNRAEFCMTGHFPFSLGANSASKKPCFSARFVCR